MAGGTVDVRQAHLDARVTRVERVKEHLGQEVKAARGLGQGPRESQRIDAGSLVVVHALPKEHVDQGGRPPGQEPSVQLTGGWVLVIGGDDIGATDRAEDRADRLPGDLAVGGQEAEVVEPSLVQRPYVGGGNPLIPRLMDDPDAGALLREAIC